MKLPVATVSFPYGTCRTGCTSIATALLARRNALPAASCAVGSLRPPDRRIQHDGSGQSATARLGMPIPGLPLRRAFPRGEPPIAPIPLPNSRGCLSLHSAVPRQRAPDIVALFERARRPPPNE